MHLPLHRRLAAHRNRVLQLVYRELVHDREPRGMSTPRPGQAQQTKSARLRAFENIHQITLAKKPLPKCGGVGNVSTVPNRTRNRTVGITNDHSHPQNDGRASDGRSCTRCACLNKYILN